MYQVPRPVFWGDRQREECYVYNIRRVPGTPQHHHDQYDMGGNDGDRNRRPAPIQCGLVQPGNARHWSCTLSLCDLLLDECARKKFHFNLWRLTHAFEKGLRIETSNL